MEETKYKLKGVELDNYIMSQARLIAPEYKPSQKGQDVIKNSWSRYSEMRTNRELSYRWFGKKHEGTYRNLVEYINVCEKRWNSDGIPRVNLEDWQASVFKPETRNKVMAILSAVAQQRPRVKFKGVEESDYLREQVLGNLYDWSENKDDGDEMALYTMLDAIIHGTAIRYEGYEDCKRVIKEISENSGSYEEIKFKEKTIIDRKVLTRTVRLQDFFFGNMSERRMDDQPDCVWRKIMRFNDFRAEFAGWEESKYVLPGGDLTDETFFSNFVTEEVREQNSDLVEVIRYYNRDADEFVILANGVWVNPIGNKVCPIPFNHKQLPFFSIVFEPFSSDFPYGKSLPDKMLNEQDAINALYNMMLDQAYVSIHKPLVTGDEDAIDDVELVPGKINYIGADIKNVLELDITPPQAAHFNMIQLMQNSLQQSSVDSVQQGQTGEAGTATEVRAAAAAAARQFLLFLQFVFHGYKRKARLRVGNILQFFTSPSQIEKILGEDGEEKFKEAFQSFKLDDVQMLNGKQGSRIIEMVGEDEMEEKMNNRETERMELEPKNMEKFYVTPEYIRSFEYDVEPIPESTIKETSEVRKAMEIEWQKTITALYPDKINRDAAFEDLARTFNKDPDKYILGPQVPQIPTPGMEETGTPMSQQVATQATGLQPGKPSLNQLQT